ncbi:hypothetical protein [Brevibacterium marinum]|uniref:Uncharacterized protein n=1 Tax=Brevibacterium marinum TaxID=418643 RepID=A0A846S0V6_9MICO|nr:hypothetical protein [Brevibacterium marinum]NJC57816.1 hypothetical protein [Brevibacterium marinum]
MKTGLGTRTRHRATAGIALTAALALPLVLSGCEDHSPVAAPTSTRQAKDSSGSPADAEPTIPPYETDLDLNAEETEAVEGALVALDRFVEFTNRLYESGGAKIAGVETIAAGESLEEVNAAAETMLDQSQTMVGQVTVERRSVSEIDLEGQENAVSIRACSPSETYHFVTPSDTAPIREDTSNPEFEFQVLFRDSSWKVAKQTWVREECAS